MLTLIAMFRRLTSLVLTGVLLVCPFLCQTDACCAGTDAAANDAVSSQSALTQSCCTRCDAGHDESASEGAVASHHRRAPCQPSERCADPCLCNGAVLSSTDVTAPPDDSSHSASLPSPVAASGCCVALGSLSPESCPPPLSGRDIRHARMSLLI